MGTFKDITGKRYGRLIGGNRTMPRKKIVSLSMDIGGAVNDLINLGLLAEGERDRAEIIITNRVAVSTKEVVYSDKEEEEEE